MLTFKMMELQYLKNIKDDEVFETKKRTPNNSVTLSTIHISKGLEYKEVFVADTGPDGLP